jgi:tetraacyldisaccharide 4'-kinase
LLDFLYSQIVRSRRRYFQRRPDVRRRLSAPVISVGNLTIGGSGKTPVAAEVARLLIGMGERPSILSRGYGRSNPVDGVVVVSDRSGPAVDVAMAGDEPLLLAHSVPGSLVVVNPSRYLAGRVAEKLGCTVHVLDDGFQHLVLERDVDLLVVAPEDLSDTRTLPFGRFREPLEAARSASALLVTSSSVDVVSEVARRLAVATAFCVTREVPRPENADPVFAFCGIAKPDQFFANLEQAGWHIAGRRGFPDHHHYSARELSDLGAAARQSGATVLVTTAKDAVKLSSREAGSVPVIEIPLRTTLDPAFTAWLADRLAAVRAA